MDDREKVIKGLECCMAETICDSKCPYKGQCDDGGYYYSRAIEEAIELLKEQEPRVLTLDEVFNYRHNAVWLERRNKRHTTIDVAIFENMENGYVLGDRYHIMREGKLLETWFGNEYNKKWRCWSARPTEEQRKAARWDD